MRSLNAGTGPRAAVLIAAGAFTLLTGAPVYALPDTTPPTVTSQAIVGPPAQIQLTVRDTGSGVASIRYNVSNGTVVVPAFTPGTTAPIVVTGTKLNPTSRAPFFV